MSTSESKFKTDADIAEIFGMSVYWVAEQAKRKRIPYLKVGRHRKYTDDHVAQIFRLLEQPAVDPLARSSRSRKGKAA